MKKILLSLIFVACASSAFASETVQKEEFDRGIGISSSVFIPKGSVGFGASFSYGTYNIGNSQNDYGYQALFGMLQGISANIVTGGVSPHVSYFVADNISVGGCFDFNRSKYDVGSASLSLTEDMSFGVNDYHYFKDAYKGAIFARYFIPFGTSKRFAMFTELRASGGYAQAETYRLTDLDKNGTYQDIYDFEIGVIPGLCAFVTNEVALEVAVGLVGLNYQKVIQHTNNVGTSVMENSGANFKVNLLNISLGISVYLPTGNKKAKK
jgi:opacity protein-like surface antigen